MSGWDKFVRGKVLGKGSFGQAVLATRKADGKQFVIKEIDISRMPKAEREASEQEAKLLMALSHPNIVRCLECFVASSKLCIVMDYCSEGDLYNICQKRRGAPLPEDTIMDWFVQMCLGLKHVHDRKILHRDIKTQNIFMASSGVLKLGDFGVSKILASTWHMAATQVGTPYYLSPEICQNKRYNQKSDVWSLGCVLYELSTGKHAFEAPNMRALIQRIIKGQYPPVPSNRSKELRDLIDRMLTLNWEKRPGINEILATPIMKARITKYLSATLQAHEFSHTIIHGKPQPGQLVVGGAPKPALPAPAYPTSAPAQAAAGALAARPGAPRPVPAALPAKPGAAQDRVGVVAGGQDRARGHSPPSPPGNLAALQRQQAQEEAAAATAAARARAERAAKEKERAAAAAAVAAAQREEEGRRHRELAAVAAHREAERMRLEAERRKLEAERGRIEADRKKAELVRQEAEKQARALQEAERRAAADEARRKAEREAAHRRQEEDMAARAAERAERDRKRQDEHAKFQAQRRAYVEQQASAARNRAAVENQLQHGQVQVYDAPAPRQRRQWQAPDLPDDKADRAAAGARDPPVPSRQPVELTPEQRRAVWQEQKAAAERNRRAAAAADRVGGLCNFLGVPNDDGHAGQPAEHAEPSYEPEPARRRDESPPKHKAHVRAGQQQANLQEAFERRRQRLEQEAAARAAQIQQYQQQHWREMREAAARNRAAAMADISPPSQAADGPDLPEPCAEARPQQQQQDDDNTAGPGAGGDELEFAAMIKDMQDILVNGEDQEQQGAGHDQVIGAHNDSSDDELCCDEPPAAALAGRFLLNGEEVSLPVGQDDSLAMKVEALRCFLESKLGTQPFLTVYRRLESLTLEDDETEVSREFLEVLGQAKLPYLQLIHQLIVCEENLNSAV